MQIDFSCLSEELQNQIDFFYFIFIMIDNPFQFEKDPKRFVNSLEHDRNTAEEEDEQQ